MNASKPSEHPPSKGGNCQDVQVGTLAVRAKLIAIQEQQNRGKAHYVVEYISLENYKGYSNRLKKKKLSKIKLS